MELLSERESVIGKLERGMYLTKFFAKKKPEKKMFCIHRETMTLVWSRVNPSASQGSMGGPGHSGGGGGGGGSLGGGQGGQGNKIKMK